jgi:hypothetical protein
MGADLDQKASEGVSNAERLSANRGDADAPIPALADRRVNG